MVFVFNIEEQNDSDNDDDKIIKAVNRLLEHIDRIGLSFENNDENPRYLLERLKNETDPKEKHKIMDSLENVLRTTLKKYKS
jgi:hypothetical protein